MKTEQQKELRILILDDSPITAELIEHVLRKGGLAFTSRCVDTREAFVHALEEFKPDLILSDYHLPGFDGLTALKIVRQTHREVPVIMVTGALTDIEAVEFIHAGAKDYILKDRMARLAHAVQRVLSVEQGIRARKAAEKAVQENEEKFRQICATTQDAILMMDSAGRIIFWNNAAEKIFGYAAEEALGKELHTLIVPERFREAFYKNIPAFVATGQGAIIGKTVELAAFGKNRAEFPVELSVSAAKLDGQWHAVGFIRDISERKQAGRALQHANRAFKTLSACNPNWCMPLMKFNCCRPCAALSWKAVVTARLVCGMCSTKRKKVSARWRNTASRQVMWILCISLGRTASADRGRPARRCAAV